VFVFSVKQFTNRDMCLYFQLNNSPIESLSIVEARKVLEKSKDKLQLIITKKKSEDRQKDDGMCVCKQLIVKS